MSTTILCALVFIISVINVIFGDSSGSISAGYGAGLYALVGKTDLGKYDLSNGSLTTISKADIPFTSETGENIGCIDNINGLYPYNLVDPSKKYKPIKLTMIYPNDAVGADDICVSNPTTGEVYIWGKDIKQKNTILIKVKYVNDDFNISIVGSDYAVNTRQGAEPGSIGVYDNKRNYLWMTGYDDNHKWAYFYINAVTGDLNTSKEIDYYAYDSMYYDINLDQIFAVLIQQSGDGNYFNLQFYYLDPETLEVTKTFPLITNGNYCGLSTIFNEDVKSGTYYQITYKLMTTTNCQNRNDLQGMITMIDVKTGTVTKEVPICPGMIDCPWSIKYYDA